MTKKELIAKAQSEGIGLTGNETVKQLEALLEEAEAEAATDDDKIDEIVEAVKSDAQAVELTTTSGVVSHTKQKQVDWLITTN